MVKKVEDTYRDQSRWNDAYGRSNLAVIDDAPERFIIDPARLSRQQLDLVAAMPSIENKEILEFGSGRGEFSVALAKLGGVVTGIDIGEDLTKLATKVAALNGVECEFVVGSIDRLPFGDGSFDYVVGKAILHHLPRTGVVGAVREACRVLRPGGTAFFVEPIENSKLFDLVQNLFPVGKSGTPQYRPSILQRARWAAYLEEADDRAVSTKELADAQDQFGQVEFRYYGLLVRLRRLLPGPRLGQVLNAVDRLLTHRFSPVKKLSQTVLVIYRK